MSVKAMDKVFSRWLLDGEFRARMNDDPDNALIGFDLTDEERTRLANVLSRKRHRANSKKNFAATNQAEIATPRRINFVDLSQTTQQIFKSGLALKLCLIFLFILVGCAGPLTDALMQVCTIRIKHVDIVSLDYFIGIAVESNRLTVVGPVRPAVGMPHPPA